MALWCHSVLIACRIAEVGRKGRRADYLSGSINLCSNLRRRDRRIGRGRRGRGRSTRRGLNSKGKRARRRWTSFYSGFLGR
jgi:hypothetical protein